MGIAAEKKCFEITTFYNNEILVKHIKDHSDCQPELDLEKQQSGVFVVFFFSFSFVAQNYSAFCLCVRPDI